jgi:hypothetical protein
MMSDRELIKLAKTHTLRNPRGTGIEAKVLIDGEEKQLCELEGRPRD